VLLHESRHLSTWLIFNVRQNSVSESLLFFATVVLGTVLSLLAYRRYSKRAPRAYDEETFFSGRIWRSRAEKEIPFAERKRNLKLCPDCREHVFVDAVVCRYCGCALTVDEKKNA